MDHFFGIAGEGNEGSLGYTGRNFFPRILSFTAAMKICKKKAAFSPSIATVAEMTAAEMKGSVGSAYTVLLIKTQNQDSL